MKIDPICRLRVVVVCFVMTMALQGRLVKSDEGMWLFNQLPTKQLSTKYAFVLIRCGQNV